jgi:hypothetical protein
MTGDIQVPYEWREQEEIERERETKQRERERERERESKIRRERERTCSEHWQSFTTRNTETTVYAHSQKAPQSPTRTQSTRTFAWPSVE